MTTNEAGKELREPVETFNLPLGVTYRVYEGRPGECPKCGSADDLEYHGHDVDTATISFKCECGKCGYEGTEVHRIEFSHFDETIYEKREHERG